MAQKDVGNKVPIYKLKTTHEVMKYYDEWGKGNKYNKDMVDWNYTGPKETVEVFKKYALNKDMTIFDAGCGSGLVGLELKKFGFKHFHGADLSQKLLDTIPKNLYQKLIKIQTFSSAANLFSISPTLSNISSPLNTSFSNSSKL